MKKYIIPLLIGLVLIYTAAALFKLPVYKGLNPFRALNLINSFNTTHTFNKSDSANTSQEQKTRNGPATSNTTALKVHMIKNGSGRNDCFLVELPDGKKMLVDAGGDRAVVTDIKGYGITSLDYVVGTHMHGDHLGGMSSVLETFPVNSGIIFYPKGDINTTNSLYKDMESRAAKKNYTIKKLTTNDVMFDTEVNGKRLLAKVLGPVSFRVDGVGDDDYEWGTAAGENYSSLVFKIQYGDMAILFAGDAKEPAENDIVKAVPDELWAQVLKVGHHASTGDKVYQCSSEFMSLVKPKYALVSNDNVNPNILKKFMDRKITYWLASKGNVTLVSDGTDWKNEPVTTPEWSPKKQE